MLISTISLALTYISQGRKSDLFLPSYIGRCLNLGLYSLGAYILDYINWLKASQKLNAPRGAGVDSGYYIKTPSIGPGWTPNSGVVGCR